MQIFTNNRDADFYKKIVLPVLTLAIGFCLGLFIHNTTIESIQSLRSELYANLKKMQTERTLWQGNFKLVDI